MFSLFLLYVIFFYMFSTLSIRGSLMNVIDLFCGSSWDINLAQKKIFKFHCTSYENTQIKFEVFYFYFFDFFTSNKKWNKKLKRLKLWNPKPVSRSLEIFKIKPELQTDSVDYNYKQSYVNITNNILCFC
jgi:hypothetical protein